MTTIVSFMFHILITQLCVTKHQQSVEQILLYQHQHGIMLMIKIYISQAAQSFVIITRNIYKIKSIGSPEAAKTIVFAFIKSKID